MGMYHGVAGHAPVGMLLCPPVGQALVRTHRVYRQLAAGMAARGIPALRFDYRGSGDSAGDSVALDWQQCLDDIRSAAAELRVRSGCAMVVGFGAQLGGALALAAAPAAGLAQLILWDPVLDGARHATTLDRLQEELRTDPMRFTRPRAPQDAAGQWLGFAVSPDWRAQVAAWQAQPVRVPTLVIDSLPAPASWSTLAAAGARVVAMQPATQWDDLHRLEHAILAPELLQLVGQALEQPA
ncbi:MAG TPA: alpha/beta fold hydrolase [Frateuria sp.]|uniref:alpha/beta fold hydrolase n=1 Tax=Frateuria sp. TaxID=2211372 RepID=UPI002DE397F8|nr:alpha/beta fold hydrolase [Frateuria sp.]